MTRIIMLDYRGNSNLEDPDAWMKILGYAVSGYGIFENEQDFNDAFYAAIWMLSE